MTKRALLLGQLIANAYPADTRLLFQQYGITVQPTGKTILDAYLVYGDRFLADLANIARKSISSFSNTTGPVSLETEKLQAYAAGKTAKGTAELAAQPSWIDKFFTTFTKAGETLSVTANAWDKITGIFSGNKSVETGDAQLQLEMFKLQEEARKEAESNQTKTYLLVGAGILVIVLGFIMYNKSH